MSDIREKTRERELAHLAKCIEKPRLLLDSIFDDIQFEEMENAENQIKLFNAIHRKGKTQFTLEALIPQSGEGDSLDKEVADYYVYGREI